MTGSASAGGGLFRYGYISNGFADHSLEQMVSVLEALGYQGIGITLDHQHLDPFLVSRQRLDAVREHLRKAGLEVVIETGARYYLDAWRKHEPTLISGDEAARRRRARYYQRALEIAAELGARVVSLWSGAAEPDTPPALSWKRLEEELPPLLDFAASRGIFVGFEPEPGMFIENLADYEELRKRLAHPSLRLTLDLGHCAITESAPLAAHIARYANDIVNVHVDDARDGRHEHLPLGEGEIDFHPLLVALREIRYDGLLLVELSRHSHAAPAAAAASLRYLRACEAGIGGER